MRLWYFPFLILAPLALVAAEQREIVVPAAGEYKTQRGNVKLLGVCRFTETDAVCWDAAGKPDQRLSSEVLEYYKKGRFSSNVRYGRKSRSLVFQMPNRGPMTDSFANAESFSLAEGNIHILNYSANEPQIGILERSFLLETMLCDVTGSHSTPLRPSKRFALREGSTFQFGGLTYRIVRVGNREEGFEGRPGPRWTIAMRVEGPAHRARYLSLTAVGHDGSAVQTVDRDGIPIISSPQRQGSFSREPDPNVFDAFLHFGSSNDRETLLTTNIDPAKIKEAFATGSESTQVRFTEILLEPK